MTSHPSRTALAALLLSAALIAISPGVARLIASGRSAFPTGRASVPEYRHRRAVPRRLHQRHAGSVARLPEGPAEGEPAALRRVPAERVPPPAGRRRCRPGAGHPDPRAARGPTRRQPSLPPPSARCAALAEKPDALLRASTWRCPHAQNLVAILGDGPDDDIRCDGRLCDLQIEGTGARPEDVVIDGRFQRHVVIRADRADGVYFRNFTVQHAPDFGIYVVETDGFVIDRMLGRWNDALRLPHLRR